MKRANLIKTLALLGGVLLLGMAAPHLEMIESAPVAEATMSVAPDTIQLWFSQELEPGISRIGLDGPSGKVTLDKTKAAAGDGTSMVVPVPDGLQNGQYTVSWRAAGDDGHPARGRFTFTIAAER